MILVMTLLCCTSVRAMTCYLTLVKDNCWKSYDVTVEIADAANANHLADLVVPRNKLWTRQAFDCVPGQTLSLDAQFQPAFWSTDKDKHFPGQRYWKLPLQMKAGEAAWNLTVCFPKYFEDVPMPPGATANCACDLANIPALLPPR